MIHQPGPSLFKPLINRLDLRFDLYKLTTSQPLPAPGLIITTEIRYQSELYLPIRLIRQAFYKLYDQALDHRPVFSSTPFHGALSWADLFLGLPDWLQFSPNPAILLRALLEDADLLERFIFFSFLPTRFNGSGFGRYPEQLFWITQHLKSRLDQDIKQLSILDAACGSGEGTWELADLLMGLGYQPEHISLSGWAIDPLEVYAATQQHLPHRPDRAREYKQYASRIQCSEQGVVPIFSTVDLMSPLNIKCHNFDLVLCNGLLGGPIINRPDAISKVAATIASLLAVNGVIVIDNCFHAGWKRRFPDHRLTGILQDYSLEPLEISKGLALKRKQV